MKKTIKFFGTMVIAAMVAFTMTACGSDKDEPSSNPPVTVGVSLTINTTNFTVDRAFWSSRLLNESEKWYTITLSNCDITNPVSPWHTISVNIRYNEGDLNVLPQGTFDIRSMSAAIVSANPTEDIAYYAVSGQVTIGANTISIPALEYTLDPDGTGTKYRGTNFLYAGPFTKVAAY